MHMTGDADGDPVFTVIAEPLQSLMGELRALFPDLQAIADEGRAVSAFFDCGSGIPGLFAGIVDAGFGLLTCRCSKVTRRHKS